MSNRFYDAVTVHESGAVASGYVNTLAGVVLLRTLAGELTVAGLVDHTGQHDMVWTLPAGTPAGWQPVPAKYGRVSRMLFATLGTPDDAGAAIVVHGAP